MTNFKLYNTVNLEAADIFHTGKQDWEDNKKDHEIKYNHT
jgi:hypothetical protein